jgi:hypothetical protein
MACQLITIRQLLIERFKSKKSAIIVGLHIIVPIAGYSFYNEYCRMVLTITIWKYMLYVSGMLHILNVSLVLCSLSRASYY